ncbi:hypothetical protein PILCRDRAFT_1681 [Piloderma croceum F 1598]|uniref:Uncharacterized protein n=1 Tax=Piloderma croceum (strain F 1598) TaxID=765440 RepID=A0A0C3BUY4_PILCF|nr:hypothetical protein PILCRDRAFT_1681 [Piloderma croceum F 1598]
MVVCPWTLDNPLTAYGRQQAEGLGHDWKDVHIDALYSSTSPCAYDTALQIAEHNHDTTLKAAKGSLFDNRRMGQQVIAAIHAGDTELAANLYMGLRPSENGATPRHYRPPVGGNSPEDVAFRAKTCLIRLLKHHGKDLDEPPKEFLDEVVINSPNVLPKGIPHAVIVSHNIFMSELYEVMFRWDTPYRMMTCNYGLGEW